MVALAEVKATVIDLYNAPETRPQKVSEILYSLGADKVISRVIDEAKAEKVLSELSNLSTLEGLSQAKTQIAEIAAPYIEKASCPEGRKEMLDVTKEFAATKIAVGNEKVKEIAAPYLSSVKETSAPYVAKLEELRRSERVEAMVEAFKEAREHPAEKVSELRSKAVDLIKYENIRAYRDHVMSEKFQEDTARLVKVELPAIVTAAAKKGADSLKTTATTLANDIEGHKATVVALASQGYEKVSAVDMEALKAKIGASATALLALLQDESASAAETFKENGFSLADVQARLQRVIAAIIAEGKTLLAPPEAAEPATEEPAEPTEEPSADPPGESGPGSTAESEYEDASEAPASA